MTNPSADMPGSDRAVAWTHHWQQTLQGSINLAGQDPVAQTLRAHWADQLPAIRAADRIADVGSGPAILARLMLQLGWQPATDASWWCVDQAGLGLEWRHALPSAIRVLDQTDFATAAPPDGPVDLLVSNFGLEYLEPTALASALPRWLRAGGQLRAVVHARHSVIDQASREGADDLALALRDVRLHALATALVRDMARAPADPMQRMMHGVETRDAYNAGVDRLKQVMEDRGRASPVLMDMLHAATRVIRGLRETGEGPAIEALEQQQASYRAEWDRLVQMQDSARDEVQVQALANVMRSSGLDAVRVTPLNASIGLVAWNIQAGP